jgi:hypothetical protein
MSKESKTFNTDTLVSESMALSHGINGLIPLTKTQKGMSKVLADEHARQLLMRTMTTFVAVDMRFDVGMKAMGEILTNLLKFPEELQRKAIDAICEAQGIPSIEYNPKAPRNSFALALFAKFPEMQQQVQGGKDTKGALRLTSYIAAYKLASGPKRKKGNGSTDGSTDEGTDAEVNPQPRTAYDLFMKFYAVATVKDKATLVNLCKRAEIEYKKWIPKVHAPASDDGPQGE